MGSLSLIPLIGSTVFLIFDAADEEARQRCCSDRPDSLVLLGSFHSYGVQQFIIVLALVPFTIALLLAVYFTKHQEGQSYMMTN